MITDPKAIAAVQAKRDIEKMEYNLNKNRKDKRTVMTLVCAFCKTAKGHTIVKLENGKFGMKGCPTKK